MNSLFNVECSSEKIVSCSGFSYRCSSMFFSIAMAFLVSSNCQYSKNRKYKVGCGQINIIVQFPANFMVLIMKRSINFILTRGKEHLLDTKYIHFIEVSPRIMVTKLSRCMFSMERAFQKNGENFIARIIPVFYDTILQQIRKAWCDILMSFRLLYDKDGRVDTFSFIK